MKWVLTTPVPKWGWLSISALVILAAYSGGFMCFGRLHNVDAASGRAFPFRSGRAESAVLVAFTVLVACGLLWAGMRAFGWMGLGASLFMAAGILGIVWLGYHFERSARAFVALACLAAAVAAGAIGGVVALAANGAAWIIAVSFWIGWVIVRVLEAPTRLAVSALANHRQQTGTRSDAPRLAE